MPRAAGSLCLLLLLGCGRVGYEPGALDGGGRQTEDAASTDAASPGDGGADAGPLVDLPGEDATLPPGWTADVWVDFSDAYTYADVQYLDDGLYPMNNRPHHMALLAAPFEPGIALVGTWDVFEVRAPDVFVPHDYWPGTPDSGGPDAFFDAVWCDDFMGAAGGLCMASGSQNGGDGVYRIEADWSIRRLSSFNNVGDLAFDPAGAFDDLGVPTIYWSGPDGLRRYGEGVFYSGMLNGAFTEVLPSGDILTMNTDVGSGERRLVIVESGTHAERVLASTTDTFTSVARQHAGAWAIVAGDVGRLPGLGYAVFGTRELVEIADDDTTRTIATAGPGWRWTHALVPPATHPLGADGPTLYVLEVRDADETNRIVRLRPP